MQRKLERVSSYDMYQSINVDSSQLLHQLTLQSPIKGGEPLRLSKKESSFNQKQTIDT